MQKNELIVRIAGLPGECVTPEQWRALSESGQDESLLTANEACQFLKISRSSLWRHFKPTLKIGSLPRWKKSALIGGGK